MEWLQTLTYWQWWIIAVIFVVLEVLLPGAFLLWLGVSAAVVGVVLAVMPSLSWETQFLMFVVLAVGSIVAFRRYRRRHPEISDQPALNRRGEQYVGRVFTLEEAIVNSQGKIRVDDTTRKIRGNDCPEGTRVQVVGVDGVVLKVQSVP